MTKLLKRARISSEVSNSSNIIRLRNAKPRGSIILLLLMFTLASCSSGGSSPEGGTTNDGGGGDTGGGDTGGGDTGGGDTGGGDTGGGDTGGGDTGGGDTGGGDTGGGDTGGGDTGGGDTGGGDTGGGDTGGGDTGGGDTGGGDTGGGAVFTVSGQLSANDALRADSDVNDPLTPEVSNDSRSTPQQVPNPVIVKGFVTKQPTGVERDRFSDEADEFDVFSVSAFENQSILLEIADFDTTDPAAADLDLGLFNAAGELLLVSRSFENSFESIVIPSDGDYLLEVQAFSGTSNYTLSVSTEFAAASFDSQISVENLRLDQMVVAHQPKDPQNLSFMADMRNATDQFETNASSTRSRTLSLDKDKMRQMSSAQRQLSLADGRGLKGLRSLKSSGAGTFGSTSAAHDDTEALEMLEMIKTMNSREGKDTFLPLDYPTTFQAIDSDPVPDRFFQWNLEAIGWTESRAQLEGITLQKRPIIAVIDSGFFVGHPDFAGAFVDQRDFVSAQVDGDGFVADAADEVRTTDDPAQCHSFHGTHVATTAVAPQNDIGITGVAPGIGLIAIKVGHSTAPNCGLFGDIANSILYAAGLPNASGSVPSTPADVINMSLGSQVENPNIVAAIARATAQGVIVVAAAGNDGAPVRSFPASSANVISVAATDFLTQRAVYSSFNSDVDIAAPGGDVTVDENGDGRGDGVWAGIASINGSGFQAALGNYQGTSMASPTVAAGIALMKGIEPSLTQSDIETMLAAGDLTVDISTAGYDVGTGFGLMSLPKMIESAVQFSGNGGGDGGGGGGGTPDDVTIVSSTPSSLDFGPSLDQLSIDLVQSGSGGLSVVSVTASGSLALADGTFPIRFNSPDSADGFGVYSFTLNRGSLEAGALSGTISFVLSNDEAYRVPLSAVNQVSQGVADSSAVFFIIEKLSADNVFEQAGQFSTVAGVRDGVLSTPDLEAGNYRIVYGTDTDNDFFICDEGELCGTLPFNNFAFDSTFVLNENIAEADFLLQDVATVGLTSFDGTFHPAISPRSISKN